MVVHQPLAQAFDLRRQAAHRFTIVHASTKLVQRHLYLIEIKMNLTMFLEGALGRLFEFLGSSHRPVSVQLGETASVVFAVAPFLLS